MNTYDTIDNDSLDPLLSKCVLILEVVGDLLCGSLSQQIT